MSIAAKIKLAIAGVVTLVAAVAVAILWGGLVGYNNTHEYQVYQSLTGSVSIIDSPGYYYKGFGTVWTYPRSMQCYYSSHEKEGNSKDSIRVTFNDGGTAEISSFVKVQFPADNEHRLLLHQDFNANPANVADAIRAHLVNCIKSTGPMMSASENQASRKAEFNQVVEEQLVKGLFEMRRTEVELTDTAQIEATGAVDANGKPIMAERKAKVAATEIVTDEKGKPVVVQSSPLERYEISVIQFSVTETEYDEQTLQQFAAKKQSYLAAEQAKAQRQEEQQQRLMIIEKGLRQVAETEAASNLEKKKATVAAQQQQEVAVIKKQQAVTEAQQKVEVADQARKEAETLKQIAKLKAETAEIDKAATISAAEAKQKEIQLGGGISEEKRVLATIAAERDAKVAAALAGIKTPGVVIVGGSDKDGKGADLTTTLMNMLLLKATGVLPPEPVK